MISRVLILIFAARRVLGLPEVLFSPPATCAPTIKTTGVVVTYESFITISHSCYSYTAQTSPSSGCTPYSCGPHPDCVLLSTTTTYVPPSDPCCETTGTTTLVGPCPSCQTGCATELVVATVTTTQGGGTSTIPPLPPKLLKKDPQSLVISEPCTTTIFRGEEWELGPTRTAYAWTETATAYANCGGCEFIVERNLNGIGPVVYYTATYNDPTPTTTTDYLCATLW